MSEIASIRYPTELRDACSILEEVIPDLDYGGAYVSSHYTNADTWEREDCLLLVTSRLLLMCQADSKGFETTDHFGTTRRNYEWLNTAVGAVRLSDVSEITLSTEQGGVSIRATSPRAVNALFKLKNPLLGRTQIGLPFDHDLIARDQNDVDSIRERIEAFHHALLTAVESTTE